MVSVVIAAHNEATVLPRTLAALVQSAPGLDLDVVVAANACTDDTAEVARAAGLKALDLAEPGKAKALTAGEREVSGFPRVYLDADIRIPEGGLSTLVGAFDQPVPPLAVVPTRALDTTGASVLVRAYSAISNELPAFRQGLFGRGLIILSEAGRARFEDLPPMVADDLFLDSLFAQAEKYCDPRVTVTVRTPASVRALFRRLVRVRRGNAAMRRAASRGRLELTVRSSDRLAWLREVVARRPGLAPAAVVYVAISLAAAAAARVGGSADWGQDQSSRRADATTESRT